MLRVLDIDKNKIYVHHHPYQSGCLFYLDLDNVIEMYPEELENEDDNVIPILDINRNSNNYILMEYINFVDMNPYKIYEYDIIKNNKIKDSDEHHVVFWESEKFGFNMIKNQSCKDIEIAGDLFDVKFVIELFNSNDAGLLEFLNKSIFLVEENKEIFTNCLNTMSSIIDSDEDYFNSERYKVEWLIYCKLIRIYTKKGLELLGY